MALSRCAKLRILVSNSSIEKTTKTTAKDMLTFFEIFAESIQLSLKQ
ncbi:hypothetical protein JCM19235_5681 [Vibrio maritimus]|uniref:Uncharacterized protein n=1 Tax=Vibrio maritimus TaxID=990268 RepID=A0A090SC58_9VIBR|nr:hypothetical protein JCM19235_5681 [Vibrio maritimus]